LNSRKGMKVNCSFQEGKGKRTVQRKAASQEGDGPGFMKRGSHAVQCTGGEGSLISPSTHLKRGRNRRQAISASIAGDLMGGGKSGRHKIAPRLGRMTQNLVLVAQKRGGMGFGRRA